MRRSNKLVNKVNKYRNRSRRNQRSRRRRTQRRLLGEMNFFRAEPENIETFRRMLLLFTIAAMRYLGIVEVEPMLTPQRIPQPELHARLPNRRRRRINSRNVQVPEIEGPPQGEELGSRAMHVFLSCNIFEICVVVIMIFTLIIMVLPIY